MSATFGAASQCTFRQSQDIRRPGEERTMDHDSSGAASSAYAYPLIIRQLLHTTLTCG